MRRPQYYSFFISFGHLKKREKERALHCKERGGKEGKREKREREKKGKERKREREKSIFFVCHLLNNVSSSRRIRLEKEILLGQFLTNIAIDLAMVWMKDLINFSLISLLLCFLDLGNLLSQESHQKILDGKILTSS